MGQIWVNYGSIMGQYGLNMGQLWADRLGPLFILVLPYCLYIIYTIK